MAFHVRHMTHTHRRQRMENGDYQYRNFFITRNLFAEYGVPASGWVVMSANLEEIDATHTLRDACEWIDQMIECPHTRYTDELRSHGVW